MNEHRIENVDEEASLNDLADSIFDVVMARVGDVRDTVLEMTGILTVADGFFRNPHYLEQQPIIFKNRQSKRMDVKQ